MRISPSAEKNLKLLHEARSVSTKQSITSMNMSRKSEAFEQENCIDEVREKQVRRLLELSRI